MYIRSPRSRGGSFVEFFKYRQAQQTGVDVTKADAATKSYPV